jgi:hypothetical protein
MIRDEAKANRNLWIPLQQPSAAAAEMTPSLQTLLDAIDLGWQVKEPIERLPAGRANQWIYCFLLSNTTSGCSCHLYTLAMPDLDQFIRRSKFPVIAGNAFEKLKE